MDWDVDGIACGPELFGDFEPREVLYEFDGPRIFTIANGAGDDFLVYICDENDDHTRHLVVPTSDAIVRALRSGFITVLDALNQPWTWLVDRAHNGQFERARKIAFRQMPDGTIPLRGTLLWPSLRPILSVRMVGASIQRGQVPASVIRRTVDGASAALKTLAEWILSISKSDGRPSDFLRQYYDLPAQRFAFASFEIAFAAPAVTEQSELFARENETALDRMGKILQAGLSWLQQTTTDLPSSEESRVMLEALSKLTPPKHGLVTEVYLGGKLTGPRERPHVLTRGASELVHRALRRLNADVRPVKHTGLIREFDKDKLSFTLRDSLGKDIARCAFPESEYDDAFAAFENDEVIVVLGHESQSRQIVDVLSIGIEPLPAQPAAQETANERA